MTNNLERDRLFNLTDKLFDESSNSHEVDQLEELLTSNPELKRDYLRYALLHGQLAMTTPALPAANLSPSDHNITSTQVIPPKNNTRTTFVVSVSVVAAVIVMAVNFWSSPRFSVNQNIVKKAVEIAPDKFPSPHSTGSSHYDIREFPIQTVATLISLTDASHPLLLTTLTIEKGKTKFASASGADVQLEGPTTFGVNSETGGVLYKGAVRARLENKDSSFSVLTSNLRIVDLGTEFRVTKIDDHRVKVEVLDGEVDVQSRVRLPIYYWNFETTKQAESNISFTDVIKEFPLSLGTTAIPAVGIIGEGALRFDNTPNSYARIVGGTGEKIGTGTLTCSSGITLEMMFVSNWTGEFKDYDEFFRKEDGIHRILLSFQNDADHNHFDLPAVEPGPCLSFGLHLEKLGYSELDMPLDGLDGRPTVAELTDGKPHHVVATYDSFTGTKSIYIDGRICFTHTFSVGTLILSGGPAPDDIGNTRNYEPFNGIIDEFAFYDFALTADEISEHYENAQNGNNYFGSKSDQLQSVRWQSVTRITEGNSGMFDPQTGLALDELVSGAD